MQNPPLNLPAHAPHDQRADGVQPVSKQIKDIRQRRRRLRGEEIDIRIVRIRQRPFIHGLCAGMVAAVVRGNHPRRLLADAPETVDDRVQVRSVVRDALRQRRADELVPALKVRRLIRSAAAAAGKREELRRRQHRIARFGLLAPGKQRLAPLFAE